MFTETVEVCDVAGAEAWLFQGGSEPAHKSTAIHRHDARSSESTETSGFTPPSGPGCNGRLEADRQRAADPGSQQAAQ